MTLCSLLKSKSTFSPVLWKGCAKLGPRSSLVCRTISSGRNDPSIRHKSFPSHKTIFTHPLCSSKLHTHATKCKRSRSSIISSPCATVFRGNDCYQRRNRSTILELYHGNEEFMEKMSKESPGLLASLAVQGQRPPFMIVDCSDSRVNDQGIFSAQPGTIFTAGNIANRFDERDLNSNAVLSFAVETLKVKHVVVLGHYGCGGVAESMRPLKSPPARPADIAVQGWINPIREIYNTSARPEIVAHREKYSTQPLDELPQLHDPAFRALVEENVKSNVLKIANSSVIRDHYATVVEMNGKGPTSGCNSAKSSSSELITEIYIHGWVYDVETGKVSDLNVSVGPPGRLLPISPFPLIKQESNK